MPPLISFPAWLTRAPDTWFTAVCRARPDLLRSDAASVGALAALAATRSAVAAAIESLTAGQLQVLHTAAVAARVNPAIPAPALRSSAQALERLVELGLLWPADAEHVAAPLDAPVHRIHSETIGLLPTSAAERAADIRWLTLDEPAEPDLTPVSHTLVANAQAAAASGILAAVLSVLDAFDDDPPSQLTNGGVGKREVQVRARTAGLEPDRAVFLLELAGQAGLLGVGGSDLDPQWLPSAEYDEFLGLAGGEAYSRLLRAWLTGAVDTTHVIAGRTGRGERIHSLSAVADAGRLNPYAGFPSALPQLAYLKYLVLAELAEMTGAAPEQNGAEAPAQAASEAALFTRLLWQRPLAAALSETTMEQVLREAQAFGLVCSPLSDPHAHALTGFGRHLAGQLRTAMTPAAVPAGYDPALVTVDPDLGRLVASQLPALQTTVLVQSDLTAVATGPVDPRLHADLDDIAVVETRGQGTVYRFTPDSVSGALQRGMSADDVTALIARVSATGIPQPLTFLIAEAAAKLRRVRVAPARSVLVVDQPDDLDALLADPLLAAAGLERAAGTVAVATVSQDRLAALLDAAGQPVGHQPAAGPAPRAVRRRAAGGLTRTSLRIPESDRESFIAALTRSRHDQGSGDPTSTGSPLGVLDVLREAQAAGTPVLVTVVSADGTRRRITVRPTQITAGRVRGIRQAGGRDTEIALGISRIAAAEAVPGEPADAPAPSRKDFG